MGHRFTAVAPFVSDEAGPEMEFRRGDCCVVRPGDEEMLRAATVWAQQGLVSLECPSGETIPKSFGF